MQSIQKSDSNIDKLSFREQLKLLLFNPSQIVNLFSRQTKKPESNIEYTTDDVQNKAYDELSKLSSDELTPLFDSQVSHLEQGAIDISEKIDSIKAKDDKTNIKESTIEATTLKVAEQQKNEIEKAKAKDEDDLGREV